MSILMLAYPAQAAASLAQSLPGAFVSVVRSIWEIGVVGGIALFAVVFKPLIVGVFKTIRLVIQPRVSLQQRRLLSRWQGVQLLNRMAKDADATQPTLAAELRYFATRG